MKAFIKRTIKEFSSITSVFEKITIENVIIFALIVIPFFEVITHFVIPYGVAFPDTREIKEFSAIVFSSLIIVLGMYSNNVKPFKNIWLLLFLAYIPISIFKAPAYNVMIGFDNINGLWNFKPYAYILVFFLSCCVISSVDWTKEKIDRICSAISWTSFSMALYVVLQHFGLDEIYTVQDVSIIGSTGNPELVGNLGQPTIVSAWLAICIPFSIYLKRWIHLGLVLLAICLTGSAVSIVASALGLFSYLFLCNGLRVRVFSLAAFVLLVSLFIFFFPSKASSLADMNGRKELWSNIALSMKDNAIENDPKHYAFVGHGIGSFAYTYSQKYQRDKLNKIGRLLYENKGQKSLGQIMKESGIRNLWRQAHNEYMEVLYGMGIIGLFLVVMAIITVMVQAYPLAQSDRLLMSFYVSLFISIVIAGGNFIWHLGAHQFYTVLSLGVVQSFIRRVDFGK